MTMQTEEQAVLVTTIDTILGPSPPSSLLFGAPAVSARQVENATHRKPGTLTQALLLQAAGEVATNRGQDTVLKTLQRAGKAEVWVIFRPGRGKPKTAPPIKTLQLLAPPAADTATPSPEVSPARSEKGAFWNKLLHRKPEHDEKPPEKIKIQLPAPHALAGHDIENMGIPMITQSVDSVEGIPRSEVPVTPGNRTDEGSVAGGETKAHLKASSTPTLRLPTPTRPTIHRSPASSPNPATTPKAPALRAPPPRPARPLKPIPPLVKPKTPIGQTLGLVISLSDCDSDGSEESPFALEVPTGSSFVRSEKEAYEGMSSVPILPKSTDTTAARPTYLTKSVPAVAQPERGVPKSHDMPDPTHARDDRSDHRPHVDVMKKTSSVTEQVKAATVRPEETGRDSETRSKTPKGRKPTPERHDLDLSQIPARPHRGTDGHRLTDASKQHRAASERSGEPSSEGIRSKSHRSSERQKIKRDRAHASESSRESKIPSKSSSKSKSKGSGKTEHHKRSRDRQSAPPATPWADVAFHDMPFRVHIPVAKVRISSLVSGFVAPLLVYRVAIQLAVVAATLYCLQRTL